MAARKGESVAAGLRRAVKRGAYAGVSLDGYRVAVTVGPDNSVTKPLEIDPARSSHGHGRGRCDGDYCGRDESNERGRGPGSSTYSHGGGEDIALPG